jgi:nodulation protein E
MRRPEHAVAITGLGALSPIGADVARCAESLREGRSAIAPWRNLSPAGIDAPMGAEIREYDPAAHFEPRRLPALDRFAQLAVVAAREAMADARLELTDPLRERTATVIATGIGAQATQEDCYRRLFAEHAERFHPLIVPRVMPNAATCQVSMDLGLRGPAFAVASACASSAHAILQGALLLHAGLADVAVVGGSEACLTLGTLRGWEALRVLSRDTCRPFSADRSGLVLGEGAAVLVLESARHALARGARVHAWLRGFGMSADARDLTQLSADGAVRALRSALAHAGMAPDRVRYINAHGTGTASNDVTETRAIREVFGAHADRLAVSSTKSLHGHLLGAAGALEAIATVLALRDGFLPPTANFTKPGEGCDLDYVPNRARACDAEFALSSSFAFGGLNAVLAFERGVSS